MAKQTMETDKKAAMLLQHCEESDSNDHVCGYSDPDDDDEDCGFADAVREHECDADCTDPCPIGDMKYSIEELEDQDGEEETKKEPDLFFESGDQLGPSDDELDDELKYHGM